MIRHRLGGTVPQATTIQTRNWFRICRIAQSTLTCPRRCCIYEKALTVKGLPEEYFWGVCWCERVLRDCQMNCGNGLGGLSVDGSHMVGGFADQTRT